MQLGGGGEKEEWNWEFGNNTDDYDLGCNNVLKGGNGRNVVLEPEVYASTANGELEKITFRGS